MITKETVGMLLALYMEPNYLNRGLECDLDC